MKIAIISRGDRFTGGASRGADELAHWLVESGHAVTHFCREFKSTPAPFQQRLYAGANGKAAHYLNAIGKRLGYINAIPFEYYLKLSRVQDSFDLFHFHDLAATVSYETLRLLSHHKPVVFTVHDCSAFTGGCIYPMGCENYKTECGSCPQLGQWPLLTRFDRTGFLQQQRRHAAAQSRVQYVFPSNWIHREMASVMPLGRSAVEISNGIDLAQMAPTAKQEARQKLGLPLDRPVILISVHDLKDERKGVGYAVEAIRKMADLKPMVISTGHSDGTLAAQLGSISLTSFGHIRDPERMALIYSAADVYLFTSLADNCPYTVLETMASGTAVVGFASGGVPEIVVSEETGLLVPARDRVLLEGALRRALIDKGLTQKWGEQARLRVEQHFSKKQFMQQTVGMYEEFVRDWQSTSTGR